MGAREVDMAMRKAALGLSAALVLALAGGAKGTTLADLAGGKSLTAGGLTFSDFNITVTGSLDPNLADYKVLNLSDGFRIAGGFAAFDAEQGDMLLTYNVSTGCSGPACTGVTSPVNDIRVVFNGVAVGSHSGANAVESVSSNGTPIASADVFNIAGGSTQLIDAATFVPRTNFTVDKDILVKAGAGGMATISFVNQEFSVVPEPGSLVLIAGGLASLLALCRKRKS
jgi:hypothetical protein